MGAATGLGIAYGTSANAPDAVATAVVGPKSGSPGADGKKIKGAPTSYDRALDGVFGPVVRKRRSTS